MKCKGCGDTIAGFDTEGYCEQCLCPECGNVMTTENERAMLLCDECDEE